MTSNPKIYLISRNPNMIFIREKLKKGGSIINRKYLLRQTYETHMCVTYRA